MCNISRIKFDFHDVYATEYKKRTEKCFQCHAQGGHLQRIFKNVLSARAGKAATMENSITPHRNLPTISQPSDTTHECHTTAPYGNHVLTTVADTIDTIYD